jgi:hypothetical protein
MSVSYLTNPVSRAKEVPAHGKSLFPPNSGQPRSSPSTIILVRSAEVKVVTRVTPFCEMQDSLKLADLYYHNLVTLAHNFFRCNTKIADEYTKHCDILNSCHMTSIQGSRTESQLCTEFRLSSKFRMAMSSDIS